MAKYIQEMTSRSQAKRELKAINDIGERLAGLSDGELERLDLPGNLLEAIRQWRNTPPRSNARKRQLKYVGKLLRDVDLTPALAYLGELDAAKQQSNDALHQLEAWRDGLLEGDEDVLAEVVERFELDEAALRELANAAAAEKAAGKPPKFARQLYRVLRRYLQVEMDAAEDERWDG